MYQNNPFKVLTGEVRLSYAALTAPKALNPGEEPKYSVTLLIPKKDVNTYTDIQKSIQAAADQAMKSKWNGVKPPTLKTPIHDGDGFKQDGTRFGDECKGCWVMTARSKDKPQVVGQDNVHCELSPSDIYSGMYARVTVSFFGYAVNGNKGVGCALGNVMKTRDGEPLGGSKASAEKDFADLETTPDYSDLIGMPMY